MYSRWDAEKMQGMPSGVYGLQIARVLLQKKGWKSYCHKNVSIQRIPTVCRYSVKRHLVEILWKCPPANNLSSAFSSWSSEYFLCVFWKCPTLLLTLLLSSLSKESHLRIMETWYTVNDFFSFFLMSWTCHASWVQPSRQSAVQRNPQSPPFMRILRLRSWCIIIISCIEEEATPVKGGGARSYTHVAWLLKLFLSHAWVRYPLFSWLILMLMSVLLSVLLSAIIVVVVGR